MSVFVLDKRGKPLMPCSEKRARLLLERRRARIHRVKPFVIRLVDVEQENVVLQPLRVKIDPGSRKTGMAVVRDGETINNDTGEIAPTATVEKLIEIEHRGKQISEALTSRRGHRRHRRSMLRYRAPRFLNRGNKAKGWIAPSLQHRVDSTMAWVRRITRWAPVKAISSELVRFDMQKQENPEISGVEYQQGQLLGYEVREYLLEKWNRRCAYCDKQNVPLQIEHIHPKSCGGSNRVSNLTLACQSCNQKKGALPVEQFMAKDPLRLARIKAQAKKPLKDAAAVNTTRWKLSNELRALGLPVELSSGGRTKYNRCRLSVPKTHALDAACVGNVIMLYDWKVPTLLIKVTGRGRYQRTHIDKYGFPRGYLMRKKRVFGFATGDMVCANILRGKYAGLHKGRVVVRASGSFDIYLHAGIVKSLHKNCRMIQRSDGYSYRHQPT